jgi:BirA family biotin operon repressor/biotin-[acetyl-CoA-carboxylase] ligase
MRLLSENLVSTVKILNDLDYHDGDSIGEKLGITRSAVWKIIKKLEAYQIEINSIKGKGYALNDHLSLLDESYIAKSFTGLNARLEIFETIESTNDHLKKLGRIEPPAHICIAEHQTKARGRNLRNWHSPFGQNLYFSYAYPLDKDLSELAGLSIVIGLAIISVLNQLVSPHKLELKWPNDIICEGKKIAGILIDVIAESNSRVHVIVGVGLNVNMQHDEVNTITQEWNSLRNITGRYFDRSELFVPVVSGIVSYINKFANVGFPAFIEEFQHYNSLMGKQIKVLSGNNEIQGKAIGIDNLGHLLIEQENGHVKLCSSGDTSVIKKNN